MLYSVSSLAINNREDAIQSKEKAKELKIEKNNTIDEKIINTNRPIRVFAGPTCFLASLCQSGSKLHHLCCRPLFFYKVSDAVS